MKYSSILFFFGYCIDVNWARLFTTTQLIFPEEKYYCCHQKFITVANLNFSQWTSMHDATDTHKHKHINLILMCLTALFILCASSSLILHEYVFPIAKRIFLIEFLLTRAIFVNTVVIFFSITHEILMRLGHQRVLPRTDIESFFFFHIIKSINWIEQTM